MKQLLNTKMALTALLAGAACLAAHQTQAQIVQTGEWENTTFGSTGPISFTFGFTATDYTFQLDTVGVFGTADPISLTFEGPITGDIVNISETDPILGDVSGTLNTLSGELDLEMTNISDPFPGFSIFNMTVDGNIGLDESSGTYRVNFSDPAIVEDFADGVFAVAVPEPTSLALLGLGGLLVARRRRG